VSVPIFAFVVNLKACAVVLKLYVLARHVMMFAFSRLISREDLDEFKLMIEELRKLLKDSFPEVRITPKFHYLLHYPTMASRFGVLRDHWTLRYESKHQYLKQIATNLGNFINIAHTLAMRHQMLQCYIFSPKTVLCDEMTMPQSGKLIKLSTLGEDVQSCLCNSTDQIWSVKEATAFGCTYSVGSIILLDFTVDRDPVFLLIKHLLLLRTGHLDIVGKLLLPVAFSKQYYAYKVKDCGWAHCHPGSEKDCASLWSYDIASGTYVSLPYFIPHWSSI